MAHDHGFAIKHIGSFLGIGISTARHCIEEFGVGGSNRLFGTKPKPRKADKTHRALKLLAPPLAMPKTAAMKVVR